jgi:branched-chain amino acid transport system substrate-binding protein
VAAALVAAVDRQNAREPDRRVLFLNYSADDPALTNDACSFWHFRFDAHAGMRMDALADALKDDRAVKKVYLLNQDYSFGHDVSREAQRALRERRPDIAIAGDEFHPIGRVKDFAPYIAKIRASGADAVITGNWGNDLTLLVKAAREQGLDTKFYTFYGNGLGAPAALGDAGVKRVIAVADWHPNAGSAASDAYYRAFRARYPAAADDYLVARMPLMVEMLAAAMTRAKSADPLAVARTLEGMKFDGEGFHPMTVRAEDHQVIQPLYVMEMDKAGTKGVALDNEGSGYGFRTLLSVPADKTAQPTTCRMSRPPR